MTSPSDPTPLYPGLDVGGLILELDLCPERPGVAFSARDVETGEVRGAFWVAEAPEARPEAPGLLPVETVVGLAGGTLLITPFPGDLRLCDARLSSTLRVALSAEAAAAAALLCPGSSAEEGEVWLTLTEDATAHDTGRVASRDEVEAVSLAAFAAQPRRHPESAETTPEGPVSTVRALVTDRAGLGHVVELVVKLIPGGTGVRTTGQVHRDAEVAGQIAIAVALGPAASEYGVVWSVRGEGKELRGTSVGLALAVGARAALVRRGVPRGWAFTGGVDLDGRVVSVSGVPAKLRAAWASGVARVAVPTADAPRSSSPGSVVEVASVEPLLGQLFASSRRRLWRWTALLLPAVLAFAEACSGLDAWLHHPLMWATHGEVPVEDVVLVEVPMVADLRETRSTYPSLFTTLADGGATAVFFDIALSASTPHDGAIAATMSALREQMPIYLPVRMRDEQPVLPENEALRAAGRFGLIEARQDALFGHVRALPAHKVDGQGQQWWHLAALTAHAHAGARGEPHLADGALHLGPLLNPAPLGEVWLPPTGSVTRVSLDGVGAAAEAGRFEDKAVVVGVTGGAEDLHRTPMGVLEGAAIEARAVQVLLRQAGLQHVSAEFATLLTLLVGVCTAALRSLVPRPRLVALLTPMLAALAGLAALASGWLVPLVAPALSVLVGWRLGAREMR